MAVSYIVRALKAVVNVDADQAANSLERLDDATTRAGESLTMIAGAAAGFAGFVGGAIFGLERMANQAFEVADGTIRMSETIGVSTKRMQEMQFAAKTVGAETRDLVDVLLNINDRAGMAAEGSDEAAKAFKDLGIDLSNLDESDPVTLFRQVADGMSGIESATRRAQLASVMFGEEGARQFTSLARKGSEELDRLAAEADSLGLIMDEGVLRKTQKAGLEMKKFRAVLESLRIALVADIMPSIVEVVERLQDWLRANDQLVKQSFRDFADFVESSVFKLIDFAKNVNNVVQAMGGWQTVIAGVGKALAAAALIKTVLGLTSALRAMNGVFKALTGGKGVGAVLAGGGTMGTFLIVVGALVISIGLLYGAIDDLRTFAQGGDSFFQDFAESLGASSEEMAEYREDAQRVADAWQDIKDAFADLETGELRELWTVTLKPMMRSGLGLWLEGFASSMETVALAATAMSMAFNELSRTLEKVPGGFDRFLAAGATGNFTQMMTTVGQGVGTRIAGDGGGGSGGGGAGSAMTERAATAPGGGAGNVNIGGDTVTFNVDNSGGDLTDFEQRVLGKLEERDRDRRKRMASILKGGNA